MLPSIEALLDELLTEIRNANDGFGRGIIETKRLNKLTPWHKPKDPNFFFTGFSALRLFKNLNRMTYAQKEKAESFISTWSEVFQRFRHSSGRPTFNYWPREKGAHFPNGIYARHFEKYSLADDLDDTLLPFAIGLMPKDEITGLVALCEKHANGAGGRFTDTGLPDLRHFQTFNTWFGVKTGPELDVCVIASAITFFRLNGFGNHPLVEEGEKLIKAVIEKAWYFNFTRRIAPHYSIPGVVFYFLANMLSDCESPIMDMEPELVIDIQVRLAEEISPLERLLCTLSLWKMGYLAHEMDPQVYQNTLKETIQPMIYFQNDSKHWKRKLSPFPLFKVENVSPGLVKSLWIEYQLLLPEARLAMQKFVKERAHLNLKSYLKQD